MPFSHFLTEMCVFAACQGMAMESAPFNRKQWSSQSLRITAKELSLVSARGKHNAIAERFSK